MNKKPPLTPPRGRIKNATLLQENGREGIVLDKTMIKKD